MTATQTVPPLESYAPNIQTRAPEGSLSMAKKAMITLGILAIAVSFIGLGTDKKGFYFSYLVAYMFTLGIALGALVFVMIQHITRAGWSIVVRRIAENMAGTIPWLAILFIPVILGREELFHHWMHPVAIDGVLEGKSGYLNINFFYVRAAIYFAIWVLLAWFFRGKSIAQDETGDGQQSMKMARMAAPGILLFGFSITFAAVDWIMSLAPHWFSTMFGLTYFAGGMMAFLAMLALVAIWLRGKGILGTAVNQEHYHDIGKLMFAFMVFWTYVNFSQYFLIHYADLPEETVWYAARMESNWVTISQILIIGHFIAPFAFLMSRHTKRNRKTLAFGSIFLLVMHWVDMQHVIVPNNHDSHGFHPHWWDATLVVGFICLFLGITIHNISRHHLLPVRDPKLKESLSFQNI